MNHWLEEIRALTAAEVLSVWERTKGQKPLRQALECLACAAPGRTAENWANLPFGHVCLALFRLRSLMFGPAMPGMVTCPRCGDRLEFAFRCQDLEGPEAKPGLIRIRSGGSTYDIRLPTATDLLASSSASDLLYRCSNEQIEPSAESIEAASASVAQADPHTEIMLDLLCPACGYRWQALLDIVAYLGQEVAHHARRLLGEVHRLASTYNWSEREILALSPIRRRAYLEMTGA